MFKKFSPVFLVQLIVNFKLNLSKFNQQNACVQMSRWAVWLFRLHVQRNWFGCRLWVFGSQNKRRGWWVCFWCLNMSCWLLRQQKPWGFRTQNVTNRNHDDKVTTAAQMPYFTLTTLMSWLCGCPLQASKHMLFNSLTSTIFSFSVHPAPPSPPHLHPLSFSPRTVHIPGARTCTQAHKIRHTPPPSVKSQNPELAHPLSLRSHLSRRSTAKAAGSDTLSHTLCFCSSTNASHLHTGRCSRQAFVNLAMHVVHLQRKVHLLLYSTFCSRLPVHTNNQVLKELSTSVRSETFCLNCFISMWLQLF